MRTARGLVRYCNTCIYWQWDANIILTDGTTIYPGHCGLYSVDCTNAVLTGDKTPPHYSAIRIVDEEDISSI